MAYVVQGLTVKETIEYKLNILRDFLIVDDKNCDRYRKQLEYEVVRNKESDPYFVLDAVVRDMIAKKLGGRFMSGVTILNVKEAFLPAVYEYQDIIIPILIILAVMSLVCVLIFMDHKIVAYIFSGVTVLSVLFALILHVHSQFNTMSSLTIR